MATLKSVISMVDSIKPNAFDDEAKTAWINECEGLVQTEVLLWASDEIITYTYEWDKEKMHRRSVITTSQCFFRRPSFI